ncbi:MAG: TrkA family potassium uptake protein [Clostridia bacterium]|nr:TrkA family potassium uptake protein [Clostridia bacterium]MBR3195225.1 TrkA family potassium uptake protein [Clostridia bacterium]
MKTILLIGLGNFGLNVATQLFQLGHHVMGIDIDEVKVNAALPVLSNAKIGDGTNPEFMGSLGIDNYDLCIVSTGGDFQNSLETTSLLKEFGAKKVISRADRDVQMKFLLRNGADEVVYPEKQVARWTAVRYTADHILDYIELGDDYSIFEVSVPKSWIGMTVGQLDIRKKYGLNIMAVRQQGKINVAVTPTTVLSADKSLLVLGEYKAVQRCFKI